MIRMRYTLRMMNKENLLPYRMIMAVESCLIITTMCRIKVMF